MSVLIVAAHPDDEVLGCGGTAAMFVSRGVEVRACILSGDAEARANRPETAELLADADRAREILGLSSSILGKFPNINFNLVPHLELVQFIESAIVETGAETIFTHHPADVNDDHKHTSSACQAAARIFQRRPNLTPLKALYYMEVPSATDWTFPSGNAFRADSFAELGEANLEKKLRALEAYRGVMRDFPHPRSREIVTGLAAFRGGQAGMKYAEAFQTAFHAIARV
jgi:LmbE family N-acetylglucosaminyl deacetylase